MLLINNAESLAHALRQKLDHRLRHRLMLRRDQLLRDTAGDFELGDLVHMVVIQPGDRRNDIEDRAGFPLFTEPAFEWVEYRDGWFEAVVILSDDGFGIAIFAPDDKEVDPAVLALLRQLANEVPAS